MHDSLRRADLLSGLTVEVFDRVARVLKRHLCAPGTRIVQEGLLADRCLMLLSLACAFCRRLREADQSLSLARFMRREGPA